LQLVSEW